MHTFALFQKLLVSHFNYIPFTLFQGQTCSLLNQKLSSEILTPVSAKSLKINPCSVCSKAFGTGLSLIKMVLTISIRVEDSGIRVDTLVKWGLKKTRNRKDKNEFENSYCHFLQKMLYSIWVDLENSNLLCKISILKAVRFSVRKSLLISNNLTDVFKFL